MSVILGLDAAWTQHRASGIAIVAGQPREWRCLAACSSYDDLYQQARCTSLLPAVTAIAGVPITIASVDMPLARIPITARRTCDNLISRAFGARGCSVHSSSPDRPGAVSADLMSTFSRAGYELAVHGSPLRDRQVLEVYPHIAVMWLLDEPHRVPYKVGRAAQYWPQATTAQRRINIHANFARILAALRKRIAGISLKLPPETAGPTELKRFEDALDGIVCAWIGAQYLEGNCQSYGDETAAIWVPTCGREDSLQSCASHRPPSTSPAAGR